ncbi:MAG: hypothetical protein HQL02_06180 [Nitrospirae bacterium]|nr:hypothetical protein [Nitrospirota bacterium]
MTSTYSMTAKNEWHWRLKMIAPSCRPTVTPSNGYDASRPFTPCWHQGKTGQQSWSGWLTATTVIFLLCGMTLSAMSFILSILPRIRLWPPPDGESRVTWWI